MEKLEFSPLQKMLFNAAKEGDLDAIKEMEISIEDLLTEDNAKTKSKKTKPLY